MIFEWSTRDGGFSIIFLIQTLDIAFAKDFNSTEEEASGTNERRALIDRNSVIVWHPHRSDIHGQPIASQLIR